MTEVPPCIYCKNCRMEIFNGAASFYVCKNNFWLDNVTGVKYFKYCAETRNTKKCTFKPDICYKIKQVFSSSVKPNK